MEPSSQAGDVERLRAAFPDWLVEARWTVAGTGPDSRYLVASRGDQEVTAWSADDLAVKMRREEER